VGLLMAGPRQLLHILQDQQLILVPPQIHRFRFGLALGKVVLNYLELLLGLLQLLFL